ncbi:MAG: radical SAM protein [Nanoarchaeota archaeon]
MKSKTKKTVIFMGYKCNNNCTFCCNSDKREFRDFETLEILSKIKNAKSEGSNYLELIGGEPTIRKDIFEIVSFAKKIGFETIMFATNGRMFSSKKFTEKILESGLNHIVFSIHGHNEKLHDELTMVPGSFRQLIKGIENLKELGFEDFGTNTTIVKQNYRYLLEIGELISNLGIDNSEFIFVDPTRGYPKHDFDELVPTYEEVSPFVNSLLKFGQEKNLSHWHVRYYPLCFIDEKYHNMVSEVHEKKTFKTQHVAPDFSNTDVEKNREDIGKIKTEKCLGCKYSQVCEGFWREYYNRRMKKENN